jgi:hypothetical protein
LAGGPRKLDSVHLCFLADGRRKKMREREGRVGRQVWRRGKAKEVVEDLRAVDEMS